MITLANLIFDPWTIMNQLALATLTFLSPNTASQARSRRIPQHQWDQFKTDIITRYRLEEKDKVARTLQWILQNGILGFTPRYYPLSRKPSANSYHISRKQLDRQLKVIWQVDKMPEISEAFRSRSVSYSQVFESQSQTEDGVGPSRLEDGLDSPPLMNSQDDSTPQNFAHNTKRRASIPEEYESSHKRRRLRAQSIDHTDSHSLSSNAHQEISQSEESLLSVLTPSGLQIHNPDQHAESLLECESEGLPFVAPSSLLPTTPNRPLNDVIAINTSDGMLSEMQILQTSQPLMASLRLLPILQQLGLGWTTGEADRLLAGFCNSGRSTTVGTLRLLNIASGFFEAHPTNEVLYPLFSLMTALEKSHKRYFHRTISCIHSVNTASDTKFLEDLLLKVSTDLEEHPSMILDQFLLQVALMLLSKQRDINDCYQERVGKATSIFQGVDTFLRCKRSNPELMELELTSYSMVHLAFGFLGVGDSRQSVDDALCWGPLLQETLEQAVEHDLKVLEDDFLHQIPGPFELVGESLQNPCLRNCLKWCKSRLKASYRLPPTLEALRRQTIDKEWAESTIIYWYLWIEYYNTPTALDTDFFGVKNTEQVMGVPASQLLYYMASLMMEISPPEKRYSRLVRRDVIVTQRAIAGAEVLEKLSDQEFARRFLSQLVDKDFPVYMPTDLNPSKLHQAATRTFHAGTKNISANLQEPTPFSGDEVPIRQPSLSATLASSHSSSTFSSMRRMAVGISKHSRARQRPSRSNSRTSALTVDDLSDTLSILTFSAEPSDRSNSAWLSRTSL
jgi:hypothetical protein